MARKMTMTKEQQIRGCRKALANPKTPKQFLPGLKKRLKKLLAAIAFVLVLPALSRAQFIGYTTPQTVTQTLASNLACTGIAQTFTVENLGQNQHSVTVIPTSNTTKLAAVIQGLDASGNIVPISDTVFSSATVQQTPALTASGYYPIIRISVTCAGGNFTLNYSGTSSQSNVQAGAYLAGAIDKALWQGASQGTSQTSPAFIPPFGNSFGLLMFQYTTGSIAGSTISVSCNAAATTNVVNQSTFNIANVTTIQYFPIPSAICPQAQVVYSSGGASANTFAADYLLYQPGQGQTTSGLTLTEAQNLGAALVEKGARWDVVSTPAPGSQGTASKAAGGVGVRHVADCVTYSAGAAAAPAATLLTINLRDGATGAGTILWQTTINAAATAAQHGSGQICGLNLIGSTNTAMTLEFSASLANESESVTLTGYDVQ